ncbi:5901_t:CDS:2, partial [Gigaspora margarita]
RPALNEILNELDKLSKETNIEFIINDLSTKIDVIPSGRNSSDSITTYTSSVSGEKESSPSTESFIKKRIELKNGNLIIDCPEDEFQLSCTLDGVIENISYLCSLRDSEIWDENGWKKIVVCIISNGRCNINERALAYLSALGVYQNNIAKSKLNNKVIRAYMYEFTTQISIQCSKKSTVKKTVDDRIFPTQILFCLKEKDKDDADSFRWFFNAFCPILNPKICVLMKAGVKP